MLILEFLHCVSFMHFFIFLLTALEEALKMSFHWDYKINKLQEVTYHNISK